MSTLMYAQNLIRKAYCLMRVDFICLFRTSKVQDILVGCCNIYSLWTFTWIITFVRSLFIINEINWIFKYNVLKTNMLSILNNFYLYAMLQKYYMLQKYSMPEKYSLIQKEMKINVKI